jgi:hypothetical protein
MPRPMGIGFHSILVDFRAAFNRDRNDSLCCCGSSNSGFVQAKLLDGAFLRTWALRFRAFR